MSQDYASRIAPGQRLRPDAPPAARPGPAGWDSLPVVMTAVILGLLALELGLIALRLGGHFSYTLDDPYIHLALADQIAKGHYGLNAGESAAPSSSILFPFLLAALSGLGLGQFAPLVINILATSASGILLSLIVRQALPVAHLPLPARFLMALSLVFSLNLVGLALTGLEHALHVAVTLGCLYGALRFLQSGRIAPWWWLCAFVEPLIRYEGASLLVGMAALLLLHRRLGAGLALLGLGVLPLVGFSAFLHHLGLPLLPNSVMVKSDVAAAGAQLSASGILAGLCDTFIDNLHSLSALWVLMMVGLLGLLGFRAQDTDAPRRRQSSTLAILALFVSLAHLLLGRTGWFTRYEIYVLALDAAVLLFGFGPRLAPLLLRATPARLIIAALLPMAVGAPYVQATLQSYKAAWAIYAQQYQMHRLAAEFYGKPVAVNDLGWVAYGAKSYVLDLWGLGSDAARRGRARDPSGQWMAPLAAEHDVGLAMIYKTWFDTLPAEWRAVAELAIVGPSLFEEKVVTLYATKPERVAEVEVALDAFAGALPEGVRLTKIAPGAPPAGRD